MADNDSSQEKTEHPSPKRIQDAREKGNVPRSKELGVVALLIGAGLGAIFWGGWLSESLQGVMREAFTLDRAEISDPNLMFSSMGRMFYDGFKVAMLIMVFIIIVSMMATMAIGGWNFSQKALEPKFDKMNPLKGIKKMFSAQSAVELVKAIGKFLFVALASIWVINQEQDYLRSLIKKDIDTSIYMSIDILMFAFLVMSAAMIIIAAIDVPFQKFNYIKNLRMTMQEVKDEMKNIEGKPEVKGKIRQMQQQIAQNRMMNEVPTADVIIVNPEHYSVAVKYDTEKSDAPYVVAKGLDDVALKIREVAKEHKVPIVSAPPLARSIYKHTEINQKIPSGLFNSVAQVLAYVYQLRAYEQNKAEYEAPAPFNASLIKVPENLQVD